ncbi:PAS domain-containing sensor histidine kinase [Nitrogeniibacter mangrovi]|uniref:histidine kinase n=1 Tax=Nitrogeniibacter mangrovi TaxID=2016596 RepID=A0A6C1B0Y8_9RHOO|nr:ATP-binding protein [Nitrogeniibacter mangrovi]QID17262.1 PAS domain-containing sensor histidine kinase [Nitrogeniibacter mangrovi]
MTETTTPPLNAAQLAEAFEQFNRVSAELTEAYAGLQGQVAQLNERLSVLMTALPAGVVVLDREGCVVQINRAASAWLGEDLDGQPWAMASTRFTATETPGEMELEAAPGAAPRRIALSATALDSGEGSIVLMHDVTDTHRMQREAERNARLAAMGEMVAGLAHQLRTPLSAALLYTSSLGKPQLAGEERTRVAGRAVERLRHLERLIRDMLLFARGDCLGREPVPVCALVEELAHTLEPIARERGIDFEHACGCGQTRLVADRKALAGALTNLLENALQFTPESGQVRLDAQRDGRQVVFTVSDTGKGIAPEQQQRLFEPFFTTRAEGTGLGLAIARGVARAHGGDIDLTSRPEAGTTFRLSVPLAAEGDDNETPHE